jgi:hypothetical protein
MGMIEIGRKRQVGHLSSRKEAKGLASLINEGNDRMGIPHQRRKRQDGHPSSTKETTGWESLINEGSTMVV